MTFEQSESTTQPRVPEWYAGRTLLVTGGTGFMGKVLLEKLLRSCPDISAIFVLVRPKRGNDARTRLHQFSALPLFQGLCSERPGILNKLFAVEGDIMKPGLGLSPVNKKMILEKVSIVFNCAASLRMAGRLKDAVDNNTLSTLRLMELAEEMKQLEVFLHLSTAFCHCAEKELEERVYPTAVSPLDVIRSFSWMSPEVIESITPSLLGSHPNVYTYSKALAEALVNEKGAKLHAVIARPSIVMPAYREPVPGWVDNLNGPVGLMAGVAKGVIRSVLAEENVNTEFVPVDIAINALILIAWTVGTTKPEGVPVYNVTQGKEYPVTNGEFMWTMLRLIQESPLNGVLWYPSLTIRTNKLMHCLCVFFFQYLPAVFIDLLMTVLGRKRFMINVQKRVSQQGNLLQYFSMRSWIFHNERSLSLETSMCEADRNIFPLTENGEYHADQYYRDMYMGIRKFCLKEKSSSLSQARKQNLRLFYLDKVTKVIFYVLAAWLFLHFVSWMTRVIFL